MTDQYCTNCSTELKEFEDIVLVASGCLAPVVTSLPVGSEWAAQESDSPYIHILCKTCAEGLVILPDIKRSAKMLLQTLMHKMWYRGPLPEEGWALEKIEAALKGG